MTQPGRLQESLLQEHKPDSMPDVSGYNERTEQRLEDKQQQSETEYGILTWEIVQKQDNYYFKSKKLCIKKNVIPCDYK